MERVGPNFSAVSDFRLLGIENLNRLFIVCTGAINRSLPQSDEVVFELVLSEGR